MALRDTQRYENVIGSIQKYLATSLSGQSVDLLQAVRIDTSGLSNWYEVSILPMAPAAFFRHGGASASSGDTAEDARILVNVNVYARAVDLLETDSGNFRKVEELVDILDQYLKVRTLIPIYQLQSGGTPATVVGYLQSIAVVVQPLPSNLQDAIDQQLLTKNYSATLRWDREIAA